MGLRGTSIHLKFKVGHSKPAASTNRSSTSLRFPFHFPNTSATCQLERCLTLKTILSPMPSSRLQTKHLKNGSADCVQSMTRRPSLIQLTRSWNHNAHPRGMSRNRSRFFCLVSLPFTLNDERHSLKSQVKANQVGCYHAVRSSTWDLICVIEANRPL